MLKCCGSWINILNNKKTETNWCKVKFGAKWLHFDAINAKLFSPKPGWLQIFNRWLCILCARAQTNRWRICTACLHWYALVWNLRQMQADFRRAAVESQTHKLTSCVLLPKKFFFPIFRISLLHFLNRTRPSIFSASCSALRFSRVANRDKMRSMKLQWKEKRGALRYSMCCTQFQCACIALALLRFVLFHLFTVRERHMLCNCIPFNVEHFDSLSLLNAINTFELYTQNRCAYNFLDARETTAEGEKKKKRKFFSK